jgi:hypothetical protein
VVGDTVTLTATPNTNYAFVRWEVTSGSASIANATSPNTTFTMTDANVAINAIFRIASGIVDPDTDIIYFGNQGAEGQIDSDSLYITKMGSDGTISITKPKDINGNNAFHYYIGFETGVLHEGDKVYLYNYNENGEYNCGVNSNKTIDKRITVYEGNGTLASMVSLMVYWSYSTFASDFELMNINGDYKFSYSLANGWTYKFIDSQGNNLTYNYEGYSNDNNGVRYLKFTDPNDNGANPIEYYLRADDPDGTTIPHQ